jgi:UDP:flavonoid glycosyltransferase YjiC (YdhE family)
MRPEAVDGLSDESPTWLDQLGSTRPLVYITAGTEPGGTMAPWGAAIAALGSLDVDAIATIGHRLDPSVLGDVPSNVRVERFVPQRFILDKASVVMSHAGAGSMLGAARRGIPQLLYPSFADQWENADAATGAGVAITCELDGRSADDIGNALQRLLQDNRFRDAASRVADEMEAMPTPTDHVATIEAIVNSG